MDEIEWYEVNAKEYAAGGYSSRQLVGAVINRFTGMVIGYRFKTGDGTYSNIAIEELTRATGQFRVSRQLDDKFIAKNGSLIETHYGAMNIDTMREYVELILTQVAVGTSNIEYRSFLDIEPW